MVTKYAEFDFQICIPTKLIWSTMYLAVAKKRHSILHIASISAE